MSKMPNPIAHQTNICFVPLTTVVGSAKTCISSLGWLTMWRKTMGLKPSNITSVLSSMVRGTMTQRVARLKLWENWLLHTVMSLIRLMTYITISKLTIQLLLIPTMKPCIKLTQDVSTTCPEEHFLVTIRVSQRHFLPSSLFIAGPYTELGTMRKKQFTKENISALVHLALLGTLSIACINNSWENGMQNRWMSSMLQRT